MSSEPEICAIINDQHWDNYDPETIHNQHRDDYITSDKAKMNIIPYEFDTTATHKLLKHYSHAMDLYTNGWP